MTNKISYVMLLSTIFGILCGIFFPEQMLAIRWIDILFINLLKLIVIPLTFCVVVSAVISMASVKRLKSVWLYTLFYVMISTSVAVLIGIVLLNIFQPGSGMSPDVIHLNIMSIKPRPISTSSYFLSYLATLFPPGFINVNDESKFYIFPVIIFSIIFGLACISVGESAKPIKILFVALRNVFNKIILWVMYLTPIGLFTLLGSSIADGYTKSTLIQNITGLCYFLLIVLLGLFCQFFWQLALIKYITRKNPKIFLKNAIPAMLTAFATSSSSSTLPITLLVAKEENIGQEIADFVLPFATTINLAGTAMYEAIGALFFCQIMGIDLSLFSQIGIFFTAILAGIGASGVPEGGIITMVIVLRSVNVPTSAIALLLPFDRILDRLRTMVNVWGDLVCAMTINHFIGKGDTKPI